MLVGTTVLAALVLLLLLSERGSSRLWQRTGRGALEYCERCDLRWPARELVGTGSAARCPRGHALVLDAHDGVRVSTLLICASASFAVVGAVLIATGHGG